ncbi:hypothetical protein TorRG33x02_125350 [Trema orientale]|uniref:Uncharacterized protein n=1 Tax=Trema orientale TaxID=63057 RepID=A0A2P5F1N7_TREOI|nr:hypothetical protein TorRG33x02_125350 [Trema orientale]
MLLELQFFQTRRGKADKSRAPSSSSGIFGCFRFSSIVPSRPGSPVRLTEIFPVLRARPGRSTGGFELS